MELVYVNNRVDSLPGVAQHERELVDELVVAVSEQDRQRSVHFIVIRQNALD